MRVILLLLPAVLMAQTTPAPTKAPASAPKGATGAVTKAAPKKAATAPPKAAPKAPPAAPNPDEKTIYALGLTMYKSLGQFNLSTAEMEILKRALTDACAGKPGMDMNTLDTWRIKFGEMAKERATRQSQAYMAKAGAEPGVVKTPSGILYKDLHVGTGASPKASDKVKVNYRGTLTNGTEFDSSYKRNEPIEFPLSGVIRCWTEGVQRMKVGGKARLVCPSDLAYGDAGSPPTIPGGATLIFEIELLGINGGQ